MRRLQLLKTGFSTPAQAESMDSLRSAMGGDFIGGCSVFKVL